MDLPDDAGRKLGPAHLQGLDEFDLIVRSPIVHPSKLVETNGQEILKKTTTVTNEFFRACPTKNIIGVTGTKGKGTTSTLIAKLLQQAGKTVHLGGNIGIPPLDLLKDGIRPEDWVVLELANFQLIDLAYSPPIGVCVMVVPEHLDWHPNLEEYFYAKKQLFAHQDSEDTAIYYAKNEYSRDIASGGKGKLLPYYSPPGAYIENDDVIIDGQSICSTDEIKMLGKHNWQNICAAVTAVWQISKDVDAMRAVLTTFSNLPFRIELRREVGGVKYYNDSFATGPGATIAAIEAVPETKVLLIGGYERGNDLSELADALINNSDKIRKVIVYGASAQRIADELNKFRFTNFTVEKPKDMQELVGLAQKTAKKGDAVVLSPAFASFDMFKNFEERGIIFNEVVEKL